MKIVKIRKEKIAAAQFIIHSKRTTQTYVIGLLSWTSEMSYNATEYLRIDKKEIVTTGTLIL